MSFQLSAAQITDYNKDGYLVVKNFLDANEINKLQQIAFDDGAMRKHAFDLNDQAGKKTKLTLWYKPGNDAYGLLTRSDRMVNGADCLMEGESAGLWLLV